MKLTNNNYFSPEASMHYFGTSQIKSFMDCEARALAECKGEYRQPNTVPLLVGSYVDSFFEGTLDTFEAEHPELFKKNGELKADFAHCNKIIWRIHQDPLFMEYMSGEKQVIKTGEIDGFPFKIKIDSYHPGKMIVDLKVMRSLERIAGRSLVDYWQYDLQGAIYQRIEGNGLPFYLAIATKEDEPNLELVEIEQPELDEAIERIRPHLPRWAAIKRGEVEPDSCGVCPYCRQKKKLTAPIPAGWLGFNNKELKYIKGEI